MVILPLKSTRALQSSAKVSRNYRGTIKTLKYPVAMNEISSGIYEIATGKI